MKYNLESSKKCNNKAVNNFELNHEEKESIISSTHKVHLQFLQIFEYFNCTLRSKNAVYYVKGLILLLASYIKYLHACFFLISAVVCFNDSFFTL